MSRKRKHSTQEGRYLEEVNISNDKLLGVWVGHDDETDGFTQHESLKLCEDGTFEHILSHTVASGENGKSICTGRWRLFNIKFFGADESVVGDREITFERDPQSKELHVDQIVVCGVDPRLNGFFGMSCKLKPIDTMCREIGNDHQSEKAESQSVGHEDVQEEEEVDVTEELVQQLQEISGRTADECLATLLQHNASIEAALSAMLEQPDGAGAAPSSSSSSRAIPSSTSGANGDRNEDSSVDKALKASEHEKDESIQGLVEISGKTWAECSAAFDSYGGRVDVAAAQLLGLGDANEATGSQDGREGNAASSSSTHDAMPSTQDRKAAAGEVENDIDVEAIIAATGTERSLCIQALRKCGGRPDDAVSLLLGLIDNESVDEQQEAPMALAEDVACEDDDDDADYILEGEEEEAVVEEEEVDADDATVAGEPDAGVMDFQSDLDDEFQGVGGDDADEIAEQEMKRRRTETD